MHAYKHILIATDLGPHAADVVARSAEIARHYHAKISLIHAVEVIPVDVSNELILPKIQEVETALKDRALTELKKLAADADIAQTIIIAPAGTPKWEVVNYAQENGVDLIVTGSHSRRGLKRLLGSTANAILNHAPCDVMVIRLANE